MTNEEIFLKMEEMFHCTNHNRIMKLGKELIDENVIIKDLNTRLVIYNNNDRIIVPTIGKGKQRKYLFAKYKIENALINTKKVKKDQTINKYFIEISNKKQTTVMRIDSNKNGKFVFLIDFSLLEQIIDIVGEDGNCLADIYIDPIVVRHKSSLFYNENYYCSEITKVEVLTENGKILLSLSEELMQ